MLLARVQQRNPRSAVVGYALERADLPTLIPGIRRTTLRQVCDRSGTRTITSRVAESQRVRYIFARRCRQVEASLAGRELARAL